MKFKLPTLFIAALLITSCDTQTIPIVDQCKRAELFAACMDSLPVGPVSTIYNDWSEVVDSCGTVSARQSYRPRNLVPKECRKGG